MNNSDSNALAQLASYFRNPPNGLQSNFGALETKLAIGSSGSPNSANSEFHAYPILAQLDRIAHHRKMRRILLELNPITLIVLYHYYDHHRQYSPQVKHAFGEYTPIVPMTHQFQPYKKENKSNLQTLEILSNSGFKKERAPLIQGAKDLLSYHHSLYLEQYNKRNE